MLAISHVCVCGSVCMVLRVLRWTSHLVGLPYTLSFCKLSCTLRQSLTATPKKNIMKGVLVEG